MKYLFIIGLLISSNSIAAIEKMTTNQISGLVGKKITVCGKVAEISTIRNNTFINIDAPHPYQRFYFYVNNQTVDKKYLFKTVCGTGLLASHKGKLQIKVHNINSLSFN